jgi:hypothetical protein
MQEQAAAGLSPADRYADLVDELAGVEGVTPPEGGSGFGRSALKFRRKIFAMLVRGRLVLKLPAQRVDALVAAGAGVHFGREQGHAHEGVVSLDPEADLDWLALAREALAHGGGA